MSKRFNFPKAILFFFYFAVSLAFVLLSFRWFPIPNVIRTFFLLIYFVFSFFVVRHCSIYFNYYFGGISTPKSQSLIFFIFVLVPSAVFLLHNHNVHNYLSSEDRFVFAQIDCSIDIVNDVGSVGHEWSYEFYFDDKRFEPGSVLFFDHKKRQSLYAIFTERDDISDVGKSDLTYFSYSGVDNLSDPITVCSEVFRVAETGGKKYAGSYRDFVVSYTITRTTPPSWGYWRVYFSPKTHSNFLVSIPVFLLNIACFIFVFHVLFYGKKQKQRFENRRFLAEKARFQSYVSGKRIRDLANVPSEVFFVGLLPSDSTESEYGSFTYYCSPRGSCYHKKKGCCYAYRPIHSFNISHFLKPCSLCKPPNISIPQWWYDYTNLKSECKVFGVSFDE